MKLCSHERVRAVAQPSSIAKDLSTSHGDRRIRVLIANAKSKGFSATTFSEAEVERVMEIDTDHSALVLRSGTEIPVALSYEQLEQKIYEPDFRTNGAVLDLRDVTGEIAEPKVPANANQAAAPGDKMRSGAIYAGISPETGTGMDTTPADAPLTMTFNEAAAYAKKLNTEKYLGHDDWRVPTKAELNVLFNNRAAIGGFDISGSDPAGWYWSSSQGTRWDAWGQRFSDGCQDSNYKDDHSSVRCVR
jgi:hypothetical protein